MWAIPFLSKSRPVTYSGNFVPDCIHFDIPRTGTKIDLKKGGEGWVHQLDSKKHIKPFLFQRELGKYPLEKI